MKRKKVLFLTNIPAPYRIDFFNELGRYCDLTVVFEARRAAGIRFNWNEEGDKTFQAVFLSDGEIDETHVDRRVFSYLQDGAYDRVVATSYGYYTETAAILSMRLKGIPYDLEIDGGMVRPGENPAKRWLKRFMIRGAGRLFSSGRVTDELFLHYGADRKQLVRYPFTSLHEGDVLSAVPKEAARARAKRMLGIPEKRVVLSVGQFIRRKGYDILLHACAGLDPQTGVYIVGGTPTEEYRALMSGYGLTNVHFLEFMEKAELDRWYLAADVFVLPTREDMWGLVINEAMANALPVVTTTGCLAGCELIEDGENGYLVPPENRELLRDRVNGLLSDPEARDRMAGNNLKKMRSYTIEAMAKLHADIFYKDRLRAAVWRDGVVASEEPRSWVEKL